jgi:hypothetical protein
LIQLPALPVGAASSSSPPSTRAPATICTQHSTAQHSTAQRGMRQHAGSWGMLHAWTICCACATSCPPHLLATCRCCVVYSDTSHSSKLLYACQGYLDQSRAVCCRLLPPTHLGSTQVLDHACVCCVQGSHVIHTDHTYAGSTCTKKAQPPPPPLPASAVLCSDVEN